jgi:hypothetical protein
MGMKSISVVSLVLFAACGSSSSSNPDATPASAGTATATGTFRATSLAGLHHALSEVFTDSKGSAFVITLTSSESCGAVSAGPNKNEMFVTLFLTSVDASTKAATAPTGPGTFSLDVSGNGPYAEADVTFFDGSCSPTETGGKFATGTVTVSQLGTDVAVGSFDLTSGSDHLTGTFDSAACTGAASLASPNDGGACH